MKTIPLVIYVFLGHVVALVSLLLTTQVAPHPLPPRKLSVRTVTLPEPRPKVIVEAPSPRRKEESPRPSPTSPSSTKKSPAPSPAKKTAAKKPETTKKLDLAAKLKADLAQLEKSTPVKSQPSHHLAIEAFAPADESAYKSDIAIYIKHYLSLPERGTAKVAMTLSREGRVERLLIENCDSEKNRTFIDQELKKLLFPPFGAFFKGEKNHIFYVVLNSH